MERLIGKRIKEEDLSLYGYSLYRRVRVPSGELYAEYLAIDGAVVIARLSSFEDLPPLVVFTSNESADGHGYLLKLETEVYA